MGKTLKFVPVNNSSLKVDRYTVEPPHFDTIGAFDTVVMFKEDSAFQRLQFCMHLLCDCHCVIN